MKRYLRIILPIAFLIIIVSFFLLSLRFPKHTAVWRGRQVAVKYGCFNCHGFEGYKGISNPGYIYGEVPAWQGGTAMMFIFDEDDIKEWILYGKLRRFEGEKRGGIIKMPAYDGTIDEDELKDLIIYLKAVMELIEIDSDSARKGYEIAKKSGCFGCHGPYGMGGMPNPGSFKGYIPGWDGEDFDELVKSEGELREWIKNGNIRRLSKNFVARFFIKRQIIKMPAYKDKLTEDEINYVISYILWLRSKVK